MAKYSAPLDEIRFLLYDVFKVAELVSELSNEVLETEITGSILSECAKLCENTLSPLNQASDLTPPVLENGFVRCFSIELIDCFTHAKTALKYTGAGHDVAVTGNIV